MPLLLAFLFFIGLLFGFLGLIARGVFWIWVLFSDRANRPVFPSPPPYYPPSSTPEEPFYEEPWNKEHQP